ncbi:MAG TPA: cytochrome c oxidase subunit 3 [Candidatus Eisenbacteria bacterium]|jgi:heme/copper-type cytochrome/quinol oxidase subunit 3|nr:cytochrome c oxidase subunit 3 [Candidatus Eisenbacteria bacterium]
MTLSGSISRRPVLTTARIGVILFLVTEVMLFAGLLTAFLVLKGRAPVWPPPGQPRLPVAATAVNTVVLLLSGAAMLRAVAQSRRIGGKTAAWLAAAAGLGLAFLVGQGIEWVRLLGYGFTTGSGVYGSTFYVVVGIHAAHVLVAVLALAVIWALSLVGQITPAHREPVVIVAFFWLFVVLVWPILYLLLYQPWAPR